MNNTEIFNVIQDAVFDAADEEISISSISSYTSVDNTCGVKFSATKSGITVPMFIGFTNDSKYSDYIVLGILNSERNEDINKISFAEDNSKNLIQDKFKFNKKFLSREKSVQIKKLSKWINDEILGFFFLFKMHNKQLFKNKDFSVNYTPEKENIKVNAETSKVIPKEESYDNIDVVTWIKIVELPWLIILFSIAVYCQTAYIKNPTDKQINVLFGISLGIFIIGLIGVLATIGKKKKIRETKKLQITKNPYTWFISKTGKVICGTLCLIVGSGFFILFSVLKGAIFSPVTGAGDSTVTSTNSSRKESYNTSKNNSSNTNASSAIQYYCTFCGERASSISSLTSSTCYRHPNGPYKGHHQIYEGSIKSRYECEYCGQSASSISSLTSSTCYRHPNGQYKGHHKPYIGDVKSTYYCKYCGQSASSISSLTSSTCYRHPDGQYKGYHSPAF